VDSIKQVGFTVRMCYLVMKSARMCSLGNVVSTAKTINEH